MRSAGLSSRKTRASTPMLRVLAIALKLAALSAPIGLENCNVILTKQHVRMLAKRQSGDVLFVFRTHSQR